MACKDREGTGSSTSRWVPSPVEGTNAGGSGCLRLEGFSRGVPVKKRGTLKNRHTQMLEHMRL